MGGTDCLEGSKNVPIYCTPPLVYPSEHKVFVAWTIIYLFHLRSTNNLLQCYKLKTEMIGVLPTQIKYRNRQALVNEKQKPINT